MPARLGAALAALDRAGVRWCLLRPTEGLAEPEGDVDVLVGPSDRGRARAALAAEGLAESRTVPTGARPREEWRRAQYADMHKSPEAEGNTAYVHICENGHTEPEPARGGAFPPGCTNPRGQCSRYGLCSRARRGKPCAPEDGD
jgi:hypothetical protein